MTLFVQIVTVKEPLIDMSKCFNCRKEKEDSKKIFCDDCEQKRDNGELEVKSSSTLVIYDKI